MAVDPEISLACPVPYSNHTTIQLAHGGGGTLTHQLIRDLFVHLFDNPLLRQGHDGAILGEQDAPLAFSTDSYVVQPLFFPGGNIGDLAVNGTVNDLAMCGARPVWLSAGFIIEEGFEMDSLERIVRSMRASADRAGVLLVTGDTKVVDKGKGDGVFINTSGIGRMEHGIGIGPQQIQSGDAILLSGDIGRHGIAVMAEREGLEFEVSIESDCAPLAAPVLDLLENGVDVHCLRDLTRGGLATVLAELAESSGYDLSVSESAIPISEGVQGACEMLGLDPMYVANEGRFIAFIAEEDRQKALEILSHHAVCEGAASIGEVMDGRRGQVTLRNTIGTERILDMLRGEQLPRIC